jgi:hypothetical protein
MGGVGAGRRSARAVRDQHGRLPDPESPEDLQQMAVTWHKQRLGEAAGRHHARSTRSPAPGSQPRLTAGTAESRCSAMGTPGSASGLGKRARSNACTAPQADSTEGQGDLASRFEEIGLSPLQSRHVRKRSVDSVVRGAVHVRRGMDTIELSSYRP